MYQHQLSNCWEFSFVTEIYLLVFAVARLDLVKNDNNENFSNLRPRRFHCFKEFSVEAKSVRILFYFKGFWQVVVFNDCSPNWGEMTWSVSISVVTDKAKDGEEKERNINIWNVFDSINSRSFNYCKMFLKLKALRREKEKFWLFASWRSNNFQPSFSFMFQVSWKIGNFVWN